MRKDNSDNDPDPPLIKVYKAIRIVFAVGSFILLLITGIITEGFPDGLLVGCFGLFISAFVWFTLGMDIVRAKIAHKQLPVLLSQMKQTRENKARGIVDPRLPKYDSQDKLSLWSFILCSIAALVLLLPWWTHTLKEDIPRAQAFWVLVGSSIVIYQLFHKRRITGKTAGFAAAAMIFGVGFLLGRIYQIW